MQELRLPGTTLTGGEVIEGTTLIGIRDLKCWTPPTTRPTIEECCKELVESFRGSDAPMRSPDESTRQRRSKNLDPVNYSSLSLALVSELDIDSTYLSTYMCFQTSTLSSLSHLRICHSRIRQSCRIVSSGFADVYKGTLLETKDTVTEESQVAIKMLRSVQDRECRMRVAAVSHEFLRYNPSITSHVRPYCAK